MAKPAFAKEQTETRIRSDHRLDHAVFASAASADDAEMADLLQWLSVERAKIRCEIDFVRLDEIDEWETDPRTGDIVHRSGRFFALRGLEIQTNHGSVSHWSQPIIDQPEVGILGILVREVQGVLQLLVQAKMEPGNIGLVQVAPTVQATHSNYQRVHGGDATLYLEYFMSGSGAVVRADVLQSEQGARFLRKRNRNMIVETHSEVPLHEGFRWVTLGQLHRLLRLDNVVNMDLRSVLSCLQFTGWTPGSPSSADIPIPGRQSSLLGHSVLAPDDALHTSSELLAWITGARLRYRLDARQIPLAALSRWSRDEWRISHDDDLYFTVAGISIRMASREVSGWMQPVVAPTHEGLVAILLADVNGVPHALMQMKLEAGNRDVVEIAPSVQCITRNYQQCSAEDGPKHCLLVSAAPPEEVLYAAYQSEEGGRFFRQQNKYLIVKYDGDVEAVESPDYRWMSVGQLKRFVLFGNYINVEARSLLACLCAVLDEAAAWR